MTQFEEWLTKKLQELNTDEGVFLPYIVDILDGEEESEDEKREGIVGLLADVLEDEAAIEKTLNEILVKWRESHSGSSSVETVVEEVSKLDITHQMHVITQEKIATSKINKTEKTEEVKKVKAAILSGYSGEADSDESEGDDDKGLVSNSNAESVQKVSCQCISVRLTKFESYNCSGESRYEGETKRSSCGQKRKGQTRQTQSEVSSGGKEEESTRKDSEG